MPSNLNILVFGASYGSLLATRLLHAGHDVQLVCLPEEAQLINAEGTRVRLPVRGREALVEVASRDLPGRLTATTPDEADPGAFHLVGLAMQEPQYRAPPVRALLERVAQAGLPTMSIMNMPPLTYLRRLPGVDADALRHCYTEPAVWDAFDAAQMTLASPDPQAFRPPEEPPNVLQVSLPTNFKVARFEAAEPTAMLRRLEADIAATRHDTGEGEVELPVKLRVHDSVFVPLAKWAMLLTGNYRCVTADGPQSIREAVHGDVEASRSVYDWVRDVCIRLGADPDDLVAFEKYAKAAEGLTRPSSAARALYAGAPAIERVDLLVQSIAAPLGMRNDVLDRTVALVDQRLEANGTAA